MSDERTWRPPGTNCRRNVLSAAFVQSTTATITSPGIQLVRGSSRPHSYELRPTVKLVSTSAGGVPPAAGTHTCFQPVTCSTQKGEPRTGVVELDPGEVVVGVVDVVDWVVVGLKPGSVAWNEFRFGDGRKLAASSAAQRTNRIVARTLPVLFRLRLPGWGAAGRCGGAGRGAATGAAGAAGGHDRNGGRSRVGGAASSSRKRRCAFRRASANAASASTAAADSRPLRTLRPHAASLRRQRPRTNGPACTVIRFQVSPPSRVHQRPPRPLTSGSAKPSCGERKFGATADPSVDGSARRRQRRPESFVVRRVTPSLSRQCRTSRRSAPHQSGLPGTRRLCQLRPPFTLVAITVRPAGCVADWTVSATARPREPSAAGRLRPP